MVFNSTFPSDRNDYDSFDNHTESHYYDPLTGLPAGVLFYDRFSLEIDYAQRNHKNLGVMVLDLDGFKYINNTLGHSIGNRIIKLISKRLKNIIRKTDTLYRLGGDEFILLIPNLSSSDGGATVAEKILDLFKYPIVIENHKIYITTSIGISLYPCDGHNQDDLIRKGDIAMYKAKEFGGNNYQFFKQDMHVATAKRMHLVNNLRQALEKDEFRLYYQPKVDLSRGIVVGMEALIRWNHPEFGFIPPLEFIPLAEETGLIISIGEWVLRTACRDIKQWHDKGLPKLTVAINLSARQLQPNLFEKVDSILEETGLDPKYLEIELTESTIAQDTHMAINLLNKIKTLGIKLSMDDFGTGYSNLTHLKKINFDCLKIDKSFIDGLSVDSSDDHFDIILAIIAMCRSLKIQTIAEGVECEEQVYLLKKLKCDYIQGYFFSKPMPLHCFEKLVSGDTFLLSSLPRNPLNVI